MFKFGFENWANWHLGRWNLRHWFSVMRTVWKCDLGSWRIIGCKWKVIKVGYLEFADWKQGQKRNFWKWNWPRKVCKWIRHDLKTDTLELFLEENTMVQLIWSHLPQIWSYNVMNRDTNQSTNADTSKTFRNSIWNHAWKLIK